MRSQTPNQITGREGERWFHSMLPPEWTIQRPFDDFGTDAIVSVGTDSQVSPLEFGVQIKSSRSLNMVHDCIVVPRVSHKALEHWLGRFSPTLLVAYDSRRKVGYCDWVQNLITYDQLASPSKVYCLRISVASELRETSWSRIREDLESFGRFFSEAARFKADVLPACVRLSAAISTLCSAELEDVSTRTGDVRRITALAWTYIGVAKEVETIYKTMLPNSLSARTLVAFQEAYSAKCRIIIVDFDRHVNEWGKEVGWIAMKKPDICIAVRAELNAMVADCLFRLLRSA